MSTGGTRKGASRRRKELALALCVSLWIAGGSVAGAADPADLYLDADDNITPASGYPAQATVEKPAGTTKTLSVTGGFWNGWNIYGGYDNSGWMDLKGYTLTLKGANIIGNVYGAKTGEWVKGNSVTLNNSATVNGSVYGGYSNANDASDNSVTLNGASVTDNVYGGYSGGSGKVSGNSVTLNGGNVTGNVYGGYSVSGDGLGQYPEPFRRE